MTTSRKGSVPKEIEKSENNIISTPRKGSVPKPIDKSEKRTERKKKSNSISIPPLPSSTFGALFGSSSSSSKSLSSPSISSDSSGSASARLNSPSSPLNSPGSIANTSALPEQSSEIFIKSHSTFARKRNSGQRPGSQQSSPVSELKIIKIRQYSSEEILQTPVHNHHLLRSLSLKEIRKYANRAFQQNDGYLAVELYDYQPEEINTNAKISSPPAIEIIAFNQNNSPRCFLVDPFKQLGGLEGAGGSVFLGYEIYPEAEENSHEKIISKAVVVKKIQGSDQQNLIIQALKSWQQYINHYEPKGMTRLSLITKYGTGPNLIDYFYDRKYKTKITTDEKNYMPKRRYVTPARKLGILIQLYNLVNRFHVKTNCFHTDIKLQNFGLTPEFLLYLFDLDGVYKIPRDKKDKPLTIPIGTMGYYSPKENEDDPFTEELERAMAAFCILEMLTDENYQLNFRIMVEEKILQNGYCKMEDFTLADYYKLMPDMFCPDEFLMEKFLKLKIQDTWHLKKDGDGYQYLSTEELFQYFSASMKNYVEEDIGLLKSNRTDVINEIIFRAYILPKLIGIFVRMTGKNYAARQKDEELMGIEESLKEFQKEFEQLSIQFNNEGPKKIIPKIDGIKFLRVENIMKFEKNEKSEEKEIIEIRPSGKSGLFS